MTPLQTDWFIVIAAAAEALTLCVAAALGLGWYLERRRCRLWQAAAAHYRKLWLEEVTRTGVVLDRYVGQGRKINKE